MPTVTVRNIPAELYEKLKRAAATNHRGINSEFLACIERAVGSHEVNPDVLLADVRGLRTKTASHPIADAELARAKTTGRL
jgi:plasmid stability protein